MNNNSYLMSIFSCFICFIKAKSHLNKRKKLASFDHITPMPIDKIIIFYDERACLYHIFL